MKTATIILIAASLVSPAIASEPWKIHSIDPAIPIEHLAGADGVRLADINGDGLLDIATGWEEGKSVRVCFHPGEERVTETWPSITVGRVSSPEDAVFADLDGDGRQDVVSATEGKSRTVYVHWSPGKLEDIGTSEKWKTESFPQASETQWWMYTLPIDLDEDGDIDLVIGSKNAGGSLTWFRNPGREKARDLASWELIRLVDAGWVMSIREFTSGETRALLYSDRKGPRRGIHLLPLLGQAPWFGEPVLIGGADEEVMFLDVGHLDDDRGKDIVAAIRPNIIRTFYQPEDPLQVWPDTADFDPVPEDQFGTMKAVRIGDLDGDEIPDVAVTCENATGKKRGVFWMNLHSEVFPISDEKGVKYDRIELLDLDGDGDLDLLTCEERAGLGVIWFENPAK